MPCLQRVTCAPNPLPAGTCAPKLRGTMPPPQKRPYLPGRRLPLACRPLTSEQEAHRRLLRQCINLCDPYLSDAAFAREQLERPPRTVRAWLSGYRPIPDYVVTRLIAMRDYLRRKAREGARDDRVLVRRVRDDGTSVEQYETGRLSIRDLRVPTHRAIAAAGVQPERISPGLGRYPRGPSVTVPSPARHDGPAGTLPDPRYGEQYAGYWLCACSKSDRYRTWRKMAVAVCEKCGYRRPF
jgi:hypothetical protein